MQSTDGQCRRAQSAARCLDSEHSSCHRRAVCGECALCSEVGVQIPPSASCLFMCVHVQLQLQLQQSVGLSRTKDYLDGRRTTE